MDGFPPNILSLLLINAVNVKAKGISIGHAGILKGLHPNILVLAHVNFVGGMMVIAMKNNIVVHVMG